MRAPNWLKLSSEPDEIIGAHKMLRWHLVPPTRFLAIYLHKHQSDDPRTLHDHPADNISIRIRGELLEYTPDPFRPSAAKLVRVHSVAHGFRTVWFWDGDALQTGRPVRRFAFRRAEDPHRLEVRGGTCWTIWIRFRVRRPWGYFEPGGWRRRRLKSDPMAAEST